MTTTSPPPDGARLLNQVSTALTRYVVLPSPEAITAVTLWIAASHAAPAWNTAARLVIRAPEKRCGKSRLLDVIEAVCHRPVMTVNASPAAIYRLIGIAEGDPPTVLIDEADTIFGPEATHEDLRGLLNAGHQRGRPALRWDVNTRTVEELETYAMVALAGIGRLPDTIEDRAVIIRMRRRARHETVQPYRVRCDAPPSTVSVNASTPGPGPTSTPSPRRCRSSPWRTVPPTPGRPSSSWPTTPAVPGRTRPAKRQ